MWFPGNNWWAIAWTIYKSGEHGGFTNENGYFITVSLLNNNNNNTHLEVFSSSIISWSLSTVIQSGGRMRQVFFWRKFNATQTGTFNGRPARNGPYEPQIRCMWLAWLNVGTIWIVSFSAMNSISAGCIFSRTFTNSSKRRSLYFSTASAEANKNMNYRTSNWREILHERNLTVSCSSSRVLSRKLCDTEKKWNSLTLSKRSGNVENVAESRNFYQRSRRTDGRTIGDGIFFFQRITMFIITYSRLRIVFVTAFVMRIVSVVGPRSVSQFVFL